MNSHDTRNWCLAPFKTGVSFTVPSGSVFPSDNKKAEGGKESTGWWELCKVWVRSQAADSGGSQFFLRPNPRAVRTDMFKTGLTKPQLLLRAFRQVAQDPVSLCHGITILHWSVASCYRCNKLTCFGIRYLAHLIRLVREQARAKTECCDMCQTPCSEVSC